MVVACFITGNQINQEGFIDRQTLDLEGIVELLHPAWGQQA